MMFHTAVLTVFLLILFWQPRGNHGDEYSASKINVHVVCHSHDDVGWLKTPDQYATGANNSIQHACTNCILTSVVRALAANPSRKFSYAEMAFFHRWWRTQTPDVRNLVRALVKKGQLDFINGGWVQHDEACTHYIDMIDQTTLGHALLQSLFGFTPKVGWQIDPFGHSSTQAALLTAEVGLASLFFGRIDYQDLALRQKQAAVEFVWQPSPSLGDSAQVFCSLTGGYKGNYGPPDGFCWDHCNADEIIQDDPEMGGYNVQSRVDDFVAQVQQMATMVRGNPPHVMVTTGTDFTYEYADSWYIQIDKLLKYLNQDGRVNAFYSTPAMYAAVKRQQQQRDGVKWPVKTDDFFPYADGPHMFWTGYFTSRPALKRYIRVTSAYLHFVQQVAALAHDTGDTEPGMRKLMEAQAEAQHHDAITGTSKQHVAFDYARQLSAGVEGARAVLFRKLQDLLGLASTTTTRNQTTEAAAAATVFSQCNLLNASACRVTQDVSASGSTTLSVVVWNTLAQPRIELIELPVSTPNLIVHDASTGAVVPSQVSRTPQAFSNYGNMVGSAPVTLYFKAETPPLGYSTYTVTVMQSASATTEGSSQARNVTSEDIILENQYLRLTFCASTNLLCSITNKESGISVQVVQNFYYYLPSSGDHAAQQRSGAYIFRPFFNVSDVPVSKVPPSIEKISGRVVQEVRQKFSRYVSQSVRLAEWTRHAEFVYTVGPLMLGLTGQEVVTRFTAAGVPYSGSFATDSNGREMQQRKYNSRPTWVLQQTEPVAGNYYPVTTAITFTHGDEFTLTALTDAPVGGSVLPTPEGKTQLELMVHRTILRDDLRGVGELLRETQFVTPYTHPCPNAGCGFHYGPGLIVRGKLWVTLQPPATAAATWRPLQDTLYSTAQGHHWVFTPTELKLQASPTASYLRAPLPQSVQVVTLERWGEEPQLLLRLAHQFAIGEDATLSNPVTVDLATLFTPFTVTTATELTLSANQAKKAASPVDPLARTVELEGRHWWRKEPPLNWTRSTAVVLGPMEIKTFLLTVAFPS